MSVWRRLPLEFLLGQVQDPEPGDVQDWIIEHPIRLKATFENAHKKLLVAANRHKECHDQHVQDLPLQVGQLVYLRDLGILVDTGINETL